MDQSHGEAPASPPLELPAVDTPAPADTPTAKDPEPTATAAAQLAAEAISAIHDAAQVPATAAASPTVAPTEAAPASAAPAGFSDPHADPPKISVVVRKRPMNQKVGSSLRTP